MFHKQSDNIGMTMLSSVVQSCRPAVSFSQGIYLAFCNDTRFRILTITILKQKYDVFSVSAYRGVMKSKPGSPVWDVNIGL